MVSKKRSVLNMLLVFGSAIVASLLFYGCGGGGGGGSSTQPGNGTLGVSLTDASAGGFDAVNVTVSKLRVHQSASATGNEAGWTDITLSPARKINLLNLTNGALEVLGVTPLPAGHYTQLRLVLVSNTGANPLANSVVLSSDPKNEIPLDTPSGVQSGIKLIHEFDVAAGQRVDLVLDFDASKSVVVTGSGKYLLKPVIKVIPTELNSIVGFVDMSSPRSNVSVTAQQNGTIIRSTVPNSQGYFVLARLDPGNYDVVLTADNCTTKVIASVPVPSTSSITVVSTSVAPITLPLSTTTPPTGNISGTVTLTPSPGSTDEAAYVAAKQTLGSGPTVTVKFQAVDVPSGPYSLTLPTDAPFLGQYGSLPIGFTQQSSALAGRYNVEASFNGYKAQTVNIDISAGGAIIQDFTLTP